MAVGRTTEGRNVASVTTASASTAITGGAFVPSDVGRTITGAGIPAGTTVASVASATAATLSAAATASGTVSVTLGALSGFALGFRGWSPESDAEAASYTVAARNAGVAQPSRITNTYTAVVQPGRG